MMRRRTIFAVLAAATLSSQLEAQSPATPPNAAGSNPPPAAQTAPPAPAATPASASPAPAAQATGPLAPLAWLEGCWRGSVNKREFREHWLPLRGDLMIGASHTVMDGKTQDYEYLRIEPRADGIWYVSFTPGQPESAFKLAGSETDANDDATTWTFDNPGSSFPQHIRYRRGTEGWLYAHVEGTIDGAERKVIYPMRRVDCQTGELIRK